ncbi:MAG: tetratricopeptide repeat protein [Gammaproteobacteria bacterium]|nr:tetratricopeptide repeat protein [Gammaproteobacteria bacterium]
MYSCPICNGQQLKSIAIAVIFLLGTLPAQSGFAKGLESVPKQLPVEPGLIDPRQIEDVALLELDQNTKAILDKALGHVKGTETLARSLHLFLFGKGFYDIRYNFAVTGSAQQTFDAGYGNCLSLASLYVASARHLGLDARFQSVEVPPQWSDLDDFYMVAGHLNVIVWLGRGHDKLIVEFSNVYSAAKTSQMKSKVIADERVLAEYYNNLAIDKLQQQALVEARAYLLKAIDTYPKIDFVWSNLGVVNKRLGDFAAAEQAYKTALKVNRKHMSSLNNLYALYLHQQRDKEAEKLAKRVERYSRKNPYNLARLARLDIDNGNLDHAIGLYKKAIKIKADEVDFYLQLASLYYSLGDYARSSEQLHRATELATNAEELARYQGKLDFVQQASL